MCVCTHAHTHKVCKNVNLQTKVIKSEQYGEIAEIDTVYKG